jgi:mannose-1-phosphate guanylyltransferase/mannose-6-phosphate isomerase
MTNQNRITPVILAGGSGTRLWPLSRQTMPKQFCRLEGQESLFQKTLKRVADNQIFASPIILTSGVHNNTVSTQLQELGIEPQVVILEPASRDTAAAIAIAAQIMANDQNSKLLVMPSDHEMKAPEEFLKAAAIADRVTDEEDRLVTFGIKPDKAETGFGYLRRGSELFEAGSYKMSEFIEKPSIEDAEILFKQTDVMWNAGIFMFEASVVLEELAIHSPDLLLKIEESIENGNWDNAQFFPEAESFNSIVKISFDYAIMEKTTRAAIVPTDPQWSDLGSWRAVWEQSERDINQNNIQGSVYSTSTQNSLVVSDGPVVGVAGIDNIIVIANKDAVLVTSKDNSQNVKTLVGMMNHQQDQSTISHPGESRPWGRFDSIDRGEMHQVKNIKVSPGGRLSLQYHFHRCENWIVVAGTATVTVDGVVQELKPSQQVFIPQGAVHRLENLTDEPVEIIEVQYGSYLGEDDIVRVEDVYGRNLTEDSYSQKNAA